MKKKRKKKRKEKKRKKEQMGEDTIHFGDSSKLLLEILKLKIKLTDIPSYCSKYHNIKICKVEFLDTSKV
jgi:hypothetical protein